MCRHGPPTSRRRTPKPPRSASSRPRPKASARYGCGLVPGAVVLALAEEAGQLGGERLARRQLAFLDQLVDRVGAALELLDVRGGLGVAGDRVRHLLGVFLLRVRELGDVDRGTDEISETLAERACGAGLGRQRDVVGNGGPQADGRDARFATRVVENADDARRPLVARVLQAELLDERRIARGAGDRRRPRVRHVGEQRAEGDDELDAEILGERDDELGEPAPAVVRLDAEEEHRVAVGTRYRACVEDVLRPFDVTREALVQRHERPRRLEVDEALGIDVGEARCTPAAREHAAGERCRLATVVPAPEGRDQDRAPKCRPRDDSQLVLHPLSLVARAHATTARGERAGGRRSAYAIATVSAQIVAAIETWITTSHHGSALRYWISPTAICTSSTARRASAARAMPG